MEPGRVGVLRRCQRAALCWRREGVWEWVRRRDDAECCQPFGGEGHGAVVLRAFHQVGVSH